MKSWRSNPNCKITKMVDIINSQLPSHIIDLILSKLSIPSFPNCRLVCKAWNNLILSGKFLQNSKVLSVHISSHHKLYCIDFDSKSLKEGKSCVVGSFTFHPRFSKFKTVNSCNGLFCFVNTQSMFGKEKTRQHFATILNPMTNECVELQLDNATKFYAGYVYGFGFSPNTKQYKIVKLSIIRNGSYLRKGIFVADIFTIGRFTRSSCGKWSRISSKPFYVSDHSDGIYLNGCLYWNGHRNIRNGGRDNVLLRFVVEDEKFQEVSFPQDGSQDEVFRYSSHIWIFNNTLYLSYFDLRFESGRFYVWKMEQDSWIKEFVIPLSSIHYYVKYYGMTSKYHFQLIKGFEDGKILCLVFGRDLILYDSKTEQIEALGNKLNVDDKLNHEGKLWIYEINSFNFGSLRMTLGLSA